MYVNISLEFILSVTNSNSIHEYLFPFSDPRLSTVICEMHL